MWLNLSRVAIEEDRKLSLFADDIIIYVHAKSLPLCPTFFDSMGCALQGPLSMGFSRQEYWSELSLPPPGDLPDSGIEPTSLMSPALAGRFFTTGATWEAIPCLKSPQTSRLCEGSFLSASLGNGCMEGGPG